MAPRPSVTCAQLTDLLSMPGVPRVPQVGEPKAGTRILGSSSHSFMPSLLLVCSCAGQVCICSTLLAARVFIALCSICRPRCSRCNLCCQLWRQPPPVLHPAPQRAPPCLGAQPWKAGMGAARGALGCAAADVGHPTASKLGEALGGSQGLVLAFVAPLTCQQATVQLQLG